MNEYRINIVHLTGGAIKGEQGVLCMRSWESSGPRENYYSLSHKLQKVRTRSSAAAASMSKKEAGS